MFRMLTRLWVPLVVAAAVTLGGTAVERLRGDFGSEPIFTSTAHDARPLDPSYIKHVTYEVYGPGQTSGSVSFLDGTAQPTDRQFTSLPWTFTVTTAAAAVLASVVAQGDSDDIGCRITVNGTVKDQQSARGRHAQTSCLVKAG